MLRAYNVKLAYVSGRDLGRILDAIDDYQLRVPDVIVADVGASIYMPVSGGWEKNAQWDELVSRDWAGVYTYDIRAMLKQFDYLQNQQDNRQSIYKRSYYYPESADEAMLRQSISSVLANNGVKAALIFSHDPVKNCGLLDIIPESATKRHAVAYLQSLFNLRKDEVMFAGDSGNDVSAICADNPGVLVANADAPTREAVLARVASATDANVFFAVGDLAVAGHGALNGNYCAGVVEGLIHFRTEWGEHLHDAQWLQQAIDSAPN